MFQTEISRRKRMKENWKNLLWMSSLLLHLLQWLLCFHVSSCLSLCSVFNLILESIPCVVDLKKTLLEISFKYWRKDQSPQLRLTAVPLSMPGLVSLHVVVNAIRRTCVCETREKRLVGRKERRRATGMTDGMQRLTIRAGRRGDNRMECRISRILLHRRWQTVSHPKRIAVTLIYS